MRFAKDEIYHIYIRGVEGRDIFMELADYRRFLLGLKEFNNACSVTLREFKNTDKRSLEKDNWQQKRKLVSVLKYILMRNHIHLLLFCTDPGDLSNFLKKNFMGYTNYFNAKYDRSGVLFQGRSKSKHITSEAQLEVILKYIPLNALDYRYIEWRKGKIKNIKAAKKTLLNYRWSSLQEILAKKDYGIIDKNLTKKFILKPEDFFESLIRWSSRDFDMGSEYFLE